MVSRKPELKFRMNGVGFKQNLSYILNRMQACKAASLQGYVILAHRLMRSIGAAMFLTSI